MPSGPGGSTIATQPEKMRHSPGGRIDTPVEKLRQMVSASMRAYRDGPATMDERRQLVVHVLNSTPLAGRVRHRSEQHTPELPSPMPRTYAARRLNKEKLVHT